MIFFGWRGVGKKIGTTARMWHNPAYSTTSTVCVSTHWHTDGRTGRYDGTVRRHTARADTPAHRRTDRTIRRDCPPARRHARGTSPEVSRPPSSFSGLPRHTGTLVERPLKCRDHLPLSVGFPRHTGTIVERPLKCRDHLPLSVGFPGTPARSWNVP